MYGGHYVFSTTPVEREYFIHVDRLDQKDEDFMYIINYHQFDHFASNPYQRFATESENILFSVRNDRIDFLLKPYLQRKASSLPKKHGAETISSLDLVKIKYRLFIGLHPQDLKQKIQCSIENPNTLETSTEVTGASLNDSAQISLSIDVHFILSQYSSLDQLLKDKGLDTYYVGARAEVEISLN
jgi:hypothetical protein